MKAAPATVRLFGVGRGLPPSRSYGVTSRTVRQTPSAKPPSAKEASISSLLSILPTSPPLWRLAVWRLEFWPSARTEGLV